MAAPPPAATVAGPTAADAPAPSSPLTGSRLAAALARARRTLPRGRTLPERQWQRRHRALLALLALHAAALPALGIAEGYSIAHALLEGGAVGVLAAAGALATRRSRNAAAVLVSVGLLTASSVAVHFSGGYIEAHFHFFVMVVLLTLYEDWLPFLLAAGYVLLHHGVVGAVDPAAVYNHPDAVAHPLRWAAIHAAFITTAGIGAVVAWRLNEDVREEHARALARARRAERAVAASHAALEEKAADLERSNRDLEQFAYVASHDLSEPLRTVASFVQLLERRYGDRLDDDGREFVDHAVRGSQRMQELIDALLSYSRAGRAELRFEVVDVRAVAEESVDLLDAAIAERDARVEVGEIPPAWADRTEVARMLQNLIGNAVKFSAGRPHVRVDGRRTAEGCTVSVTDNGVGIDPSQAERIFEMFRRLHTRDEAPGAGIGLAICQRIVERHGGRIWVEPNPGGGSVFRFTLPPAGTEAES